MKITFSFKIIKEYLIFEIVNESSVCKFQHSDPSLILTVSNDGFLYVVDKNKGNIIRITDLYKNYKNKIRKEITPVGFVIGGKNLYLIIIYM